ncbi:hypothetical protein C5167_015731 [Papaver somniferum]|uniref:BED-type domain-containing protein n=1 Tax=Papaver somniferum TaxID=3469 RepID=A0A4Y7JAB8_PAPSO|nr:hypothetical protein C5167_015731 [Papaver somniferum]
MDVMRVQWKPKRNLSREKIDAAANQRGRYEIRSKRAVPEFEPWSRHRPDGVRGVMTFNVLLSWSLLLAPNRRHQKPLCASIPYLISGHPGKHEKPMDKFRHPQKPYCNQQPHRNRENCIVTEQNRLFNGISLSSNISGASPASQPPAVGSTEVTPSITPEVDVTQVTQQGTHVLSPESEPYKKGKARLKVCNDYMRLNEQEAQCKHCNKKMQDHSRENGTSSMKTHLGTCSDNPNKKLYGQKSLMFRPPKPEQSSQLVVVGYDKDMCRRRLTEFVIIYELPFRIVRCATHVLTLVVKNAVMLYHKSISRIRSVIKYVTGSSSKLYKFKECAALEKIDCKKMIFLYVKTRWNSIYLMLEDAIPYERVFKRLERKDKSFRDKYIFKENSEEDNDDDIVVIDSEDYFLSSSCESECEVDVTKKKNTKKKNKPRHHAPYAADWSYAMCLVKCLKIFFDATVKFSASTQVTTHEFLWQLALIHEQLVRLRAIGDRDSYL